MTAHVKRERPIWLDSDHKTVKVIDQRLLPHQFVILDLVSVDDIIFAIADMVVRGAPLIGVTGAYGVMLAALEALRTQNPDEHFQNACQRLKTARPTAVNLAWAVERIRRKCIPSKSAEARVDIARKEAGIITEEEAERCRLIGTHGVGLIEAIHHSKNGQTVNILTHCNAGWLACVEYGTATAPIYMARDQGLDVHVWVDETRPLNQGARLTAWELMRYGIKNTIITDNAGGHLMQHEMVDLVIVGTDRTTHTGDVANKIGTYLKALAAKDNNIPFYVALPSSTFDWTLTDGVKQIPIEERDPDEVRYIQGLVNDKIERILVPKEASLAANFAFDVTPARLVTGFITERGICKSSRSDILKLFPEKKEIE
jgi:methylthioribose-1-phosphate isomerase